MRYGTDRKEDSRRHIVELASERLRRDGIAGMGPSMRISNRAPRSSPKPCASRSIKRASDWSAWLREQSRTIASAHS
jgi:hypothetical protein